MAVIVKSTGSWEVTPCSLVVPQRLGGTLVNFYRTTWRRISENSSLCSCTVFPSVFGVYFFVLCQTKRKRSWLVCQFPVPGRLIVEWVRCFDCGEYCSNKHTVTKWAHLTVICFKRSKCEDGILIRLLTFWILSIIPFLCESAFERLDSVYWLQLSRLLPEDRDMSQSPKRRV
jgi:hypothetical protein